MRAREGLAACLWNLDRREEALSHYREMLRLNPNDNQGIRYTLLSCLLKEAQDQEAERLLQAYQDDAAAMWLYSAALLMFRQDGASRKAHKHLQEALEFNPHVPDYLLGRRYLPPQLPPYMGLGDETEAVHYVASNGYLWRQQEGALAWLRQEIDKEAP
jgi:tetratricopeptide (TPR) repeat protein